MPLEASSLIGSLGGIGAIAQEVFGKDGGSSAPARNNRAPGQPPRQPRSATPGLPSSGSDPEPGA